MDILQEITEGRGKVVITPARYYRVHGVSSRAGDRLS
jgi:hypothetical protein